MFLKIHVSYTSLKYYWYIKRNVVYLTSRYKHNTYYVISIWRYIEQYCGANDPVGLRDDILSNTNCLLCTSHVELRSPCIHVVCVIFTICAKHIYTFPTKMQDFLQYLLSKFRSEKYKRSFTTSIQKRRSKRYYSMRNRSEKWCMCSTLCGNSDNTDTQSYNRKQSNKLFHMIHKYTKKNTQEGL